MNLTILLLLALSLCFDSFAVSLSCGMAVQEEGAMRGRMFRFAVVLAVCQGVAPLIGWTVAANFRAAIEAYDHWVAFVLLSVLPPGKVKQFLLEKLLGFLLVSVMALQKEMLLQFLLAFVLLPEKVKVFLLVFL